jgi:chromosomal replication initiator protein
MNNGVNYSKINLRITPQWRLPTIQLICTIRFSRFEWGIISEIQPPDTETIAILNNLAKINKMMLPDDVVNYIASSDTSDIRKIEGVILQLSAYISLRGLPIKLKIAKRILENILGGKS